MFLLNKLFQSLTAFSLLAVLEILLFKENLLWYIAPVPVAIVILTLWFFNKKKFNKEFFSFLASPLLYVVISIGFSLFIEKNWMFHLFAVFISGFIFVYLGRILDYKFYPKRYQPYSLENFSWYLNLIIIFLYFSLAFALIIFLKVKLLILVIITLAVTLVLCYQLFWVNKIKFTDSNILVLAISVVLVEMFVAIYYLPTSFFVNAFILSIAFYLMTGLSRYFLLGNLDRKRTLSFLIVSGVCLLAILATAQWV